MLSISHAGQISICPTREITASSGQITSPNYPRNYSANIDCTLTLKQPLDTNFTFTFAKIDIEEKDDTFCYDHLEISDTVYCGTITPAPLVTGFNVVKLTMVSDNVVEMAGFDLRFTTVQMTGLPTAISVCPTRTITPNVTGRVHSPGFSDEYGANLDCKLTFKVPVNKELLVTYSYVDIEDASQCTKDKLLVTDGNFNSPVCGTRSQYNLPLRPYTFKNGDVSFHFTSDADGSGRGFLVTYKLTDGATHPSTSDSGSNVGLLIGILVPAVLVFAIVSSVLVYCLWKHKRDDNSNVQTSIKLSDIPESKSGCEEPAQNEQPGSKQQPSRELPPVPDADKIYEELEIYTKLDSSKRASTDGNIHKT